MDVLTSCVGAPSLQPPPPPPSSSPACRQHRRRLCGTLLLSSSARLAPLVAAPLSPRTRNPLFSPRRSSRRAPVTASSQFNAAKALTTAWRVAKDGVEAGAKLVPDSVPRPVARVSVAAVAAVVALFLLKSLVSTVLFVVAMMGLIYFAYIAFNASEEGPSEAEGGGGAAASDDETLEEARRIMEKYK